MHYQHPGESTQDEWWSKALFYLLIFIKLQPEATPSMAQLLRVPGTGPQYGNHLHSLPKHGHHTHPLPKHGHHIHPFPNITAQGLQPPPTLGIPCFVLFPSDVLFKGAFFPCSVPVETPGVPSWIPKMTRDPSGGAEPSPPHVTAVMAHPQFPAAQ